MSRWKPRTERKLDLRLTTTDMEVARRAALQKFGIDIVTTEIEHVWWDELAGDVKRERITERFWIPQPKGWFYEAWRIACDPRPDERKVVWFGVDWAKDAFPKRELTDEDRAIHRAIVAMQRPTRANEF